MHLLLPGAVIIEYETLLVCRLFQVQLCIVYGCFDFIGNSPAHGASVLAFKFNHVGCMVVLTFIGLTLRSVQVRC